MRIIKNSVGSRASLHFIGTETITVAGNNSVSNVSHLTENVHSASITGAYWGTGSSTGTWTIARGANTVAVFNATGRINFAQGGVALTLDNTQPITVTLTGSTLGFLILDVSKQSDVSNSQYLVG